MAPQSAIKISPKTSNINMILSSPDSASRRKRPQSMESLLPAKRSANNVSWSSSKDGNNGRQSSSDLPPPTHERKNSSNVYNPSSSSNNTAANSSGSHIQRAAGHRPVTSCTHCRQHKIKCDASDNMPRPCSRCQKIGLKCEIDPSFKPQKGGQIQTLRNDIEELRATVQNLQRNEQVWLQRIHHSQSPVGFSGASPSNSNIESSPRLVSNSLQPTISSPNSLAAVKQEGDSNIYTASNISQHSRFPLLSNSNAQQTIPDAKIASIAPGAPLTKLVSSTSYASITIAADDPPLNDQPHLTLSRHSTLTSGQSPDNNAGNAETPHRNDNTNDSIHSEQLGPHIQVPQTEFILGDARLSLEKARQLHKRFINDYLPYLPILVSHSPTELYSQSQLLFWTVMLTACLSDPDPTLYTSLASLIKQLAIETCWIRTPRSTHIVQALLILGTWPLPNQKVLDDCSYRFIGLAKNLGLQLGLHRGKFIDEFSRTQVSLDDAEKWRTRTWHAVFFCDQFWSANLGLPHSLQTDYLIERARTDGELPHYFRSLISLAVFQCKLTNAIGSSVSSPDGLLSAYDRAGSLAILERQLDRLKMHLDMDNPCIEIYYLYVKLMVCCFSFLPETPIEDQTKYVGQAYQAGTRIVTLMSHLSEDRQLIEYPIYVRQSVSYAAFVLFRLHLTPYLLPQQVESCRQSIVTVHRLFRNMLTAWKDVENDISRTAKVLEKLNFVIVTYPELFTKTSSIIERMRSHLAGSLFYELVYCVHEARRRYNEENKPDENGNISHTFNLSERFNNNKYPNDMITSVNPQLFNPLPLPFYNQISKEDFTAELTTTPNGTTITSLVPTTAAMSAATKSANAAGLSEPTQINGIPISMLEGRGVGGGAVYSLKRPQPENNTNNSNYNNNTNDNNTNNSNDNVNTNENNEENTNGLLGTLDRQKNILPSGLQTPTSGVAIENWAPQVPNIQDGRNSVFNVTSNDFRTTANTPGITPGQTPGSMLGIQGQDFQSHFDYLMQGIDLMDGKGDDFLGWMNVSPEF